MLTDKKQPSRNYYKKKKALCISRTWKCVIYLTNGKITAPLSSASPVACTWLYCSNKTHAHAVFCFGCWINKKEESTPFCSATGGDYYVWYLFSSSMGNTKDGLHRGPLGGFPLPRFTRWCSSAQTHKWFATIICCCPSFLGRISAAGVHIRKLGRKAEIKQGRPPGEELAILGLWGDPSAVLYLPGIDA